MPQSQALQATEVVDEQLLYCFAQRGLVMRAKPGAQATLVKAVPYGAKLRLIDDQEYSPYLVVDNIRAGWRRVAYLDYQGYIFAGLLSPLVPPRRGEALADYLARLKQTHPQVEYSISAYEPGSSGFLQGEEILISMPGLELMQAYRMTQGLLGIPAQFKIPRTLKKTKVSLEDPRRWLKYEVSRMELYLNGQKRLTEIRYLWEKDGAGVHVSWVALADRVDIIKSTYQH